MKKTHLIDLFMSIKTTRVSFISIIMFVTLGIGVFLGFSWTGRAFDTSTNHFVEKYKLHDVEVSFPNGFSDEDIEEIRNIDGVEAAEGRHVVYDYFKVDGSVYQAKIIEITDEIDTLYVIEGNLPQNCGEIAVDKGFADKVGIKLHDTVSLKSDRTDGALSISDIMDFDADHDDISKFLDSSADSDSSDMLYLNTADFVVTALVISPEYACNDQTVYGAAPTNGMTVDTGLFVNGSSFNGDGFTGYTDVVVTGQDLRDMDYASSGYESAAEDLSERILEAVRENAVDKNFRIEAKISAFEKAIDDELSKTEAELNAASSELEAKRKELEAAKAAGLELESEEQQLEEESEKLSSAREKYNTERENGAKAEERIESAYIAAEPVSSTRLSVGFLTVTRSISIILNSIRYSLAGLFFIVGILVCYSAVTRLVFSQMKLIGVKKALGLTQKEVTLYYLFYTGIAAFTGCILGTGVGYASECLILNAFSISYPFDSFAHLFEIKLVLASAAVQLMILLAVTYASTAGILKKSAITLLNGTSAGVGGTRFYEKLSIYKRFSFLNKIIISNAFTDKRRVIGTVIGIIGCTALIVTALTYGRSVSNSFRKHMTDYCHFNHVVYYDSNTEGAKENIESVLTDCTDIAANCRYEYDMVEELGDSLGLLNIFVYDDAEKFSKAFTVSERENLTGSGPYAGTWIGYGYMANNSGKDCSNVEVTTMNGEKINVPIDGFMGYYLPLYTIVMPSDNYEAAFGKEADFNAFLISISNDDMKGLEEKLSKIDGYIMTNDYYSAKKLNFSIFEGISAILDIIYVVLAIVMSVLVLLNLLRQFIDEKKNELIVMLINGFDIKDARKYIYTDTIVLTVAGIILGTILGTVLGILTVKGFESGSLYFLKQPDLVSCLSGILGTAILSFVMCRISLRKIDEFKLTDITR